MAGQNSYNKGNLSLSERNYDQAVFDYLDAVEKNPSSSEYRMRLSQAREQAALVHQSNADDLFSQEKHTEALLEYRLAADLDSSLFSAYEGVKKSQNHLQSQKLVAEADQLLQASQISSAKDAIAQALKLVPDYNAALELKDRIKQSQFALVDGVELDVISTQPIDLNFNKTKLPDVFAVLTKLSGINFILDEDIRDKKTTFYLENATFAQSLELLLRMNKLDKKILNSKTIILYPKTRDKKKQFEDQVIQTFYLSNLDAKKAVNMLRTMLQVRKIYVQEDLNAIVLRDQPDVIRLAQKLIEANDRGNSEVVFDLELIEVNHSDTRDLGVKLSTYSVGAGLSIPDSNIIINDALGTNAGNLVRLDNGFNPIKDLDSFYTLPSATFRFAKTLVDAEILASPKIRVKNKEKAKVHVGTREPVITATTNDGVTTDSVQYVDVGVKLNVEPQIQLDNTIITKIGLEVSNVSGRQTTARGTAVITISSTNADTTLTLKDGEQTIIGGLIRNDKSTTKNKIPFLGDIPLLGELFNATGKTKTKREILLSITPHIVKTVQVPTGDAASIWSGGEDDLKFGRNFGTFADEYQAGQELPQVDNDVDPQLRSPEVKKSVPPVPAEPIEQDSAINTKPEDLTPPIPTEVIEEKITGKQSYQSGMRALVFVEGPATVKQNSEIEIKIMVENAKDLYSTPLTIKYDPSKLLFVGASEGSLLAVDDQATVFTQTAFPGKGKVLITLKQSGDAAGVSGLGELCHLKFKAIGSGHAEARIVQTDFLNVKKQVIATDKFKYRVEITQ